MKRHLPRMVFSLFCSILFGYATYRSMRSGLRSDALMFAVAFMISTSVHITQAMDAAGDR